MTNLEQDLLDLRQVSVAVENYICSQSYLLKYGQDEISIELLLRDSYELVLDELKELGIIFWDTENSILEDWYTARCIYHARSLFDQLKLTRLVHQNRTIIPVLETIVTSDEGDDSNIILVLDALHFTFSDDADISFCIRHMDRIISDEQFDAHVLAILNQVKNTPLSTIDNLATVTAYLKRIDDGRIAAAQAVEKLKPLLQDTDTSQLDKWVAVYDLDKIAANDINIYAIVDNEDGPDLPDELRVLAKRYMDAHHQRTPHHIEYWLAHNKLPDYPALTILVAHHWMPDKSQSDFNRDVDAMVETGQAVLGEIATAFIRRCQQLLYPAS